MRDKVRSGGWMRWLRVVMFMALGTGAVGTGADACAQTDPVLSPLERGRLVLWIVHPAPKSWSPDAGVVNAALGPVATPRQIQESTAGSFGTASSNVGTIASNYGQNASTLGHNASDVGAAASDTGQTAGSFGTESSNVGTTAGSYGQTVGSFGQTASTYGESLSTLNNAYPKGLPVQVSKWLRHNHGREWDDMANALTADFPGLQLVMYDLREEDLSDALRVTAGTADSPDALLGAPIPWRWAKLIGGQKTRLVMASFVPKSYISQSAGQDLAQVARWVGWAPEIAVMTNTPHAERARAFAVWMTDGTLCGACGNSPEDKTGAGVVALRAVNAMIQNGSVDSDADVEMAHASASQVRTESLGGGASAEKLGVRATIIDLLGNDRFAAVAVRAVVSSGAMKDGAFGVVHTLVILRRASSTAKWKVLQITPGMSGTMMAEALHLIDDSVDFTQTSKVTKVSLAAPLDGDTRGLKPDLWWDNAGDSSLKVVEWQYETEAGWNGSRLIFLPDRQGGSKTRATASFATDAGTYRWRVWAIGDGGPVMLSGWRTIDVVP